MAANDERGGHAADGQRRDEFSHRHARKSGEKDHGLGDAVGKAAGEDDRPGTAPVEQTLHLVQRPGPDEALHESPRGGEHQAVAEKAAGDQAEAAQQSAEQCSVDDAERGDHGSLRDWQHQIGPDESNAQGPCPALVFSERQHGIVGLLGCRDRRAGGKHERQNADHDQA